ncbi:MAG: hypothetical protein JNL08_03845, partial [Planctomycetes bacterium]|nr:hypothetical protein [Planctomycetota bacterium]
ELLCGKVPFTGDSEWEVLKAHETRQPEWPPHLTAVERAVLQRCLQKDPAARFQSVHDIVAAFGAQTATGAAAWSDVRAGAGTAAAAAPAGGPPPLPAVPPPPFDAARSPAQRLADEAMRGAQHIADQAVAGARRAFLATNMTIRETMQELRRGGQGAAMAKLRARFRRHHTEPAPAPAPKRRSGWHTALTVVGAGALSLLVLAFLFLWLLPARMEPSGPVVEYEPMAPVAAVPVPAPLRQFSLGSDRAQVFTSYMLPDRWRELVSTSEPAWVDLARRDPDAGAAALAQHLERLRARGPYRARDRIDAELPGIRSGRTIDEPVRAELDELVGRVKAGTDVDEALVDRVITIGPLALAHLAAQFDQLDLRDAEGSRQAHVVHATLAAATGCREIEFVTGSPAAAAAYNRPLGALWTWFVNEVANTERAWRTYRDLRGGR